MPLSHRPAVVALAIAGSAAVLSAQLSFEVASLRPSTSLHVPAEVLVVDHIERPTEN
jgi:hypothetical protein